MAPQGVELNMINPKTNIGEMLVQGELDATLLYLNSKNLVDRSQIDVLGHPNIEPLFKDPFTETTRYFRKTGLFPINHTVVMKRELYEKHPWLALNIYHAFVEAKRQADLDAKEAMQSMLETGVIALSQGLKSMDWQDQAKKYGMKNSKTVLLTIAAYIYEQGLSQLPIQIEDIFAASTLEL